jgi:Raf kinase inhibitor-like YbhB/YbcL family protein
MHRVLSSAAAAALALCPIAASAAEPPETVDVQITGHILMPKPVEPTDDRIGELKLPSGFTIEKFAEGLINPRIMAVTEDGTLYVTRREVGDVIMLKDTSGDGKADLVQSVAGRPQMHGIYIDGKAVYLATDTDIYSGEIAADGSFGELTRIVDDLPDGAQHPNRTLAVGPDGLLYVSVGSSCNACQESNPEHATMLQMKPDGTQRKIFASGLRNTIGFGWHPDTGEMWGPDHNTDWLGDDEHPEEFNLIKQGSKYGWPYVHSKGDFNPRIAPPNEISHEEWAKASEEPVLTYTAHAAPMQMVFYTGAQFPKEYRGDAFIAMRGSWNRKPPSGYEVVRVRFKDGKPQAIEPFITGFLTEDQGNFGYIGRPVGLALSPDGSLFVGDDSNGVIYRVSYDAPETAAAETAPAKPAANAALVEQDTPKELARDILGQAPALDVITPAFEANGKIPLRHSAYGQDFSPALKWGKAPEGAKSFVILMEDPDAAKPTPFVHWILYNVPVEVTALAEGVPGAPSLPLPEGARQGVNDRGSFGYFGPKPPDEKDHHYHFQVFALDTTLDLPTNAARKDILDAMKGHVLAQGEIVGVFNKSQSVDDGA